MILYRSNFLLGCLFFTRSIFIVFAGLAFLLVSDRSLATPVFINELHYDNAGSDINEGVEIAGPAGTSLENWILLPTKKYVPGLQYHTCIYIYTVYE